MDFGVFIFPTTDTIDGAELGLALEERGFESLFFPEHTHIPSARKTPWPSNRPLPPEYWHSHDPFVALSFVAAATTRLKIGTGICLVPQRDPIVTAKAVASLDVLSGGRFLFGVGGGWNREETEHHGSPFDRRFAVMRERILAMKRLWTQDEAGYEGEFVRFEPSWSWPKPLQKPHPPILVGGNGPHTLQRVVEYGDVWMPVVGREGPPFEPRIAELQRLAADKGRQPIPVNAFGAPVDPSVIETYLPIGVTRCIFYLESDSRDAVLRRLDELANVMRHFR